MARKESSGAERRDAIKKAFLTAPGAQREPVGFPLISLADRTLVDRGRPDDLLELGSHLDARAAKRPASQPVRIGTPNPHDPA